MPEGGRAQGEPPRSGGAGRRERPDGTRVAFVPHPTLLRDASGGLVGAVNMLLDAGEREPGQLEGARILVIAGDLFAAAELDLLIDDAGGVAPALVGSLQNALAFLRRHRADAAVVSPPVDDGHPEAIVEALIAHGVPCILAEASGDQLVDRLIEAMRKARPRTSLGRLSDASCSWVGCGRRD